MSVPTGGSAFPVPAVTISPNGEGLYADPGMSLRDWFAGMALQGVLAGRYSGDTRPAAISEACYLHADAMLKAREASY